MWVGIWTPDFQWFSCPWFDFSWKVRVTRSNLDEEADQTENEQHPSICSLDFCDVRGVAERGRNCSLNFYVSGFDIFDWLKTWTSFCIRNRVGTVAYIVFSFGSYFDFLNQPAHHCMILKSESILTKHLSCTKTKLPLEATFLIIIFTYLN